jgi:hypothetical protein
VKNTQDGKRPYVKPQLQRIVLRAQSLLLACREETGTDMSPYGYPVCVTIGCKQSSFD